MFLSEVSVSLAEDERHDHANPARVVIIGNWNLVSLANTNF